jgi:uroporphyrinogen III methyltransferase/synthase
MAGSTPVAMVRWGTTGRQQVIEGTLETIATVASKAGFSAPAVTIIGDVVTLRSKLNWFERRPFFGKRIVVTRTREQASQLSRQLIERGSDVLEIPTIRIVAPKKREPLVEALAGLSAYDWAIFTSPNGVNAFFESFLKAFPDLRDLGAIRIAAVGPATAAKIRELHLQVDLMPEEYVASKIAGALAKYESIENLRILLLRAEVANRDLPKLLEDKGAIVDDVACYRTVAETEDPTGTAARFQEEGADWITFASSSAVEHFHARFNLIEVLKRFPMIQIASIGPETSKALVGIGMKPSVEARVHTIDGLVQALEDVAAKVVKPGATGPQ